MVFSLSAPASSVQASLSELVKELSDKTSLSVIIRISEIRNAASHQGSQLGVQLSSWIAVGGIRGGRLCEAGRWDGVSCSFAFHFPGI